MNMARMVHHPFAKWPYCLCLKLAMLPESHFWQFDLSTKRLLSYFKWGGSYLTSVASATCRLFRTNSGHQTLEVPAVEASSNAKPVMHSVQRERAGGRSDPSGDIPPGDFFFLRRLQFCSSYMELRGTSNHNFFPAEGWIIWSQTWVAHLPVAW